MDYEALEKWIDERLTEGEDATVYDFIREVMDKSKGADEYRESAEAKMREYEDRAANYDSEISRLKAHNYDLLMKVEGADEIEGDGAVEEVVEDDGELYHIDNLFVDDDDEKGED